MKTATIYDVANACGLSPATVSRVLNNTDYPVSANARKKVLDASQKLDYTPNPAGVMLKTQRNMEIGLIVPNIYNYTYALFVSGVQQIAAEKGYHIDLAISFDNHELELQNIEQMKRKRVAGLIMVSLDWTGHNVDVALATGLKVISAEQAAQNTKCPRVVADHYHIPFIIMDYLIAKGHKNIMYLSASLDRPGREQLYRGYKDATMLHQGELESSYAMFADPAEDDTLPSFQQFFEGGIDLAERLLKRLMYPTAIFCNNDMLALGVIDGLKKHGISIPQDISIVGIDNSPFASSVGVQLTSVDENTLETGRGAAHLLIAQIEGEVISQSLTKITPATLIERDSVRQLL